MDTTQPESLSLQPNPSIDIPIIEKESNAPKGKRKGYLDHEIKKQVAKALKAIGYSDRERAAAVGVSHASVQYWDRLGTDWTAENQRILSRLSDIEADDLRLIGAKARARLHELLDGGMMKPIELIACQDRSFQQRRLLEGDSTANIATMNVFHLVSKAASEKALGAIPEVMKKKEYKNRRKQKV